MVLGTVVKIILSIQAIIGIIAGIALLVAPVGFEESTGISLGSGLQIYAGLLIAFQGFILYGLSRLHEK